MKSITFPNGPIKMAGNLHLPKDFSRDRSYVAIVVVHPAGGVKEQTAGLCASKLAEEGFVALAYDTSYQGASSGKPRQEEDPYARVEDVRAAVDYLTTQGFVDQQRICVFGICSGGGYAINAAMTDRRINAVGTVSAINLGAMYRAGYEGTVADMSQAFTLLEVAAKARTAEARRERMAMLPFAPAKREEGQGTRLSRGLGVLPHAARTAPQCAEHRSGSQPGSAGFLRRVSSGGTASDAAPPAYRREQGRIAMVQPGCFQARREPRQEPAHRRGCNPHRLYDTPEYVKQAMDQLVPLYQNAGKASPASNFIGPLSAHPATYVAAAAASSA